MNADLAIAYDELGLHTMIENFIGQVRYHPDPAALARYTGPQLIGNPSLLHEAPGPLRLIHRAPNKSLGCETLLFEAENWLPKTPRQKLICHRYSSTHGAKAKHTVIVLHGALVGIDPKGLDQRPYQHWCTQICKLGFDALFVELPFHMGRTPEGRFSGELFLSGDLIRTVDSLCQGVAEIRALISWMYDNQWPRPGIMGFSLGGLLASQIICTDDRLAFAALLAPVPEPARTFNESLLGKALHPDWCHSGLNQGNLVQLFKPIRPAGLTPLLKAEHISLIAASYDQTIELEDMQSLQSRWKCEMRTFDMGHFALPAKRKVLKSAILPFLQRYL